jgi:tRNA pseudouridine55 synthase
MPKLAPIDGALVVNKSQGKTSHDVVESMRRIAGFRQIGHLGTLDPLATGVLVLLLGRATRLMRFYTSRRKRYTCAVRFGFSTDTYDAEGKALSADSAPHLDRARIEELASQFEGRIEQTPPAFSAKKIHGRAAHELARRNKRVELKPVEVDVHEFRVTQIEGSVARFVVECGSGTYIRSLANDLGQRYGSGAHLVEIVRTAVGEFTLDRASTLEELRDAGNAGRLDAHVIRLEALLPELPHATVLPIVERRVCHGAKFNVLVSQIQPGQPITRRGSVASFEPLEWQPTRLRVFNQQKKLIAIAEAIVPRTYQPILVLGASS